MERREGEDPFGAILEPWKLLFFSSSNLRKMGGQKVAFFISFERETAWASDDPISWAFQAHIASGFTLPNWYWAFKQVLAER